MGNFGEMPNLSVKVESIEEKLPIPIEKDIDRLRCDAHASEITKFVLNLPHDEILVLDKHLNDMGLGIDSFVAIDNLEDQRKVVENLEIMLNPEMPDNINGAKSVIENFLG